MARPLEDIIASLPPDEQAAIAQDSERRDAVLIRRMVLAVLTDMSDADILTLWELIASLALEGEGNHD